MSNKNFMSYDDANNIFSSYAEETKKRLLVSSTMPAPSLDYLNTQRLYVGESTDDYTKGGTYECNIVEGSDPIEYTWVLISVAEVDLSDYKTTFVGTSAEWTALSADEKAKYILVNITDDNESLGSEVVDAVTDGVLNPVTSNAVYDALTSKQDELTNNGDNITGYSNADVILVNKSIHIRNGLHPIDTFPTIDGISASGSTAAYAKALYNYLYTRYRHNCVCIGYNSSGIEYTIIVSMQRGGQHGSVVRFGYSATSAQIIRLSGGTWADNDWVNM